jgi:zinc protease
MPVPQNIQEHRLDDGLKVLIKPMRTTPVVSVWIWYHVGSRCERPGITGISHWVEHMLFKGTPTFGKGEIMKSIGRVGGTDNGFTREDDTVYFETLPAEHLDLGLRLEADRMVNSTFDPGEVASERSVIISEREGAENYPQMRLMEDVIGTAYQVHPYRWSVVGYKSDLQKITREDLFEHYRRFYAPGNATLVLVGDLEPEKALDLVRRRFGDIPSRGVQYEVRSEEPEQVGERRVEVRRPGNAIYWTCVYHIPPYAHADRLPLMVLEAVLSGARALSYSGGGFLGKSARLHDALVNRKKLAVWAGGGGRFLKDPGLFSLWMMLRDGVKPERAEAAIFAEIQKMQDSGPRPAELKRTLRQVRAQVEYARDGITANAFMIGQFDSVGALAELDTVVDRIAVVSAEDVVRVARTYLVRRNRTVGVFIPEGGGQGAGGAPPAVHAAWFSGARCAPLRGHSADRAQALDPLGRARFFADAWAGAAPGSFAVRDGLAAGDGFGASEQRAASEGGRAGTGGRSALLGIRERVPDCGAAATLTPPIQERVLACGARVLGIGNWDSHGVAIAGFLRAGGALDPPGREGLAYLTVRMLDQGTKRKNYRQVAALTDGIGASIYFSSGADSTDFGGKCLAGDLPKVLGLLKECLSEASVPEAELGKVRQQILTAMKADRDSTSWLAMRAAVEALYPAEHPYHRDLRGTPETLGGLGRGSALDFIARFFGPQNLTVALVGPLSFDAMCRQVDRAFGPWRPLDAVPAFEPQPVQTAVSPGEKVITVPGKSQCDIVMAWIAVPRTHPDYHALWVAASIFGQFGLMGRIGERVRDQMGLAYYASAYLDAQLQAGHLAIRAGVNPANVRKALAAIREETERFCTEPVTEQELNDSIGYLVGSLVLRMETSDSLAYVVRDIALHNLPLDYLERYRAEIRAVHRERVLELARTYLAGAEPVVTIAGPELPERS